ncbi:MAG: FkbM family methyltransferase [Chitinophagaceae bacterium]|nr:FkbM family methyltransferase [Chitinophagaceae bacterium]
MSRLSDIYRSLPSFKGKKRLGSLLFRQSVYKYTDKLVRCKDGLMLHILNTQDSVGRDLFFDGEYEPETVNLINSILKEGDIMIDAGANIGAISLPVAKANHVQVYAFEPAKHVFEILEKNVTVNNLKNVIPVRLALSDVVETHEFYESNRVHGWSGMVKIDSFQHYQVDTTTLDAFAGQNNIQNIKVLKADVQGWEYFVFRGAENLISEGRIEYIIFELEWWAEQNAGLEVGTAQHFLLEKGYVLETLDGRKIDKPLTHGTKMIVARLR